MKLCLNMIVRNESAIIERCLRSTLPHVACYVICDTGSTDDTLARVRGVFDEAGIAGEIHEYAFIDFAQARNEALERCRRSPLAFDAMLFIDADMELVVTDSQWRETLNAEAYLVRQTTQGGFTYWNIRILKRTLDARYVGATHEYLAVDTERTRLEGAHMFDHSCGSSHAVKHERDLDLLRRAHEQNPTDTRTLFYLGQTLREMGRHAEAIATYEQRISLGGWDQEMWYSRYMVAFCHLALNDRARFMMSCLEAYDMRPTRAEPLYALADHHRLNGRHETCAMLAEVGLGMAIPDDLLFVDESVYRTGFKMLMSISGWYSSLPERKARGRMFNAELMLARNAPTDRRQLARANWRWYARACDALFGTVRFVPLSPPLPLGYHPCNPSLTTRDTEIWCVVRGVNYVQENGRYTSYDGVIRTTNRLVCLDAHLALSNVREIIDDSPYSLDTTEAPNVVGLEDVRVIAHDGRLRATCVVVDRHGEWRRRIAVLDLADDGRVEKLTTQGHENHLHQKNWMPFVDADGLGFVYLTDPTVVLRWNEKTRQCGEWRRHDCDVALENQRGSSGLVPFDTGWLCVTHEVSYRDSNASSRVYLHRFVHLDETFRVRAVTEAFYFRHVGIEFCAGLVAGPAKGLGADELLLSFGVNDGEAWLVVIGADAVRRQLQPVMGITGPAR
ncbi:MAG: hypothetical protein EB084_14930 [Proteobacteria bacterium]|nr:hypothetical protein [Pseudomonadota bacterium]